MTPKSIRELFSSIDYQWNEDNSFLESVVDLSSPPIKELVANGIKSSLISSRVRPIGGRPLSKEYCDLSPRELEKKIKIRIEVNNSCLRVFKDVDHLSTICPTSAPDSFILTDEDGLIVVKNGQLPEDCPVSLDHYFKLSDIWSTLKEYSEDSKTNTITFLYRRKLQIKNSYSKDILDKGLDGYALFSKLLKAPKVGEEIDHKVEKTHILQNTLLSFLEGVDLESRFDHLLNNFDKFSLRLDESYQAYVVGFSFDKLREEHEEKYREFMVAINDSISSMILKSLMIPSGVFLLATRTQAITSKADLSNGVLHIVSNFGVTACAIFIAIVFYLLLSSEAYSLSAIKFEYRSLMGRLKDKSSHAFSAISAHEARLSMRIEFAENVIKVLHCINVIYALIALAWGLTKQFPVDIKWFI
ncbi:TPA: hypothetical protein ACMDVV_001299 [Vibrio parahaemolyticus]|nr:hypothetical protein [Vibrio parahaemolyticus]